MNAKISAHKRVVINGLLTVTQIERLSSNLIRITFSCDKTLNVDSLWIGPHLKLLFAKDNQPIIFPELNDEGKVIWSGGMRERVRTYSIRYYEQAENRLTIDFVAHKTGIATTWAQQAKIGDTVGLIAMGSKNRFTDNQQLILLGDISAMPAISYTLEHLPANQNAMAIIEVRNEQDKATLKLTPQAKIKWLVTPQGAPSQLIEQVKQLDLATDDNNLVFWGGMESSISQQLRHFLKDNFSHLSSDAIRLISYWREGYAEGEFKHHD